MRKNRMTSMTLTILFGPFGAFYGGIGAGLVALVWTWAIFLLCGVFLFAAGSLGYSPYVGLAMFIAWVISVLGSTAAGIAGVLIHNETELQKELCKITLNFPS